MTQNKFWSVSALVNYLKDSISSDYLLKNLWLKGEISNFKNQGAHWYFSLKDETSRINCVMFASHNQKVKTTIKDGMSMLVRGAVSVYTVTGSLQFYAEELLPYGVGDLYLRYQELHQKLSQAGIFDVSHKKPLPAFPLSIGLVTGQNSAAMHDVYTTITRRWPVAKITPYFTLVQGSGSHLKIIEALKKADGNHHDVLLLVRGGGSLEDLWAFNEEDLIKTIYQLKTPTVTGIGHESDTTLSDLVSDVRANTPTGAAELAVPDIREVRISLVQKQNKLVQLLSHRLSLQRQILKQLEIKPVYRQPQRLYQPQRLQLSLYLGTFINYQQRLQHTQTTVDGVSERLFYLGQNLVRRQKEILGKLQTSFSNRYENIKVNARYQLALLAQKLDALSPLKTLQRGYAIARIEDQVIKSINQVKVQDQISVTVSDGHFEAYVTNKEGKQTDGRENL